MVLRADRKGHIRMLVVILNRSRDLYGCRNPFTLRLECVVRAFESVRPEAINGLQLPPELPDGTIPSGSIPFFMLRADLDGHLRMLVWLQSWASETYASRSNQAIFSFAESASAFVKCMQARVREFEIYQEEVQGRIEQVSMPTVRPPTWPT
jgi:hypothetical protein